MLTYRILLSRFQDLNQSIMFNEINRINIWSDSRPTLSHRFILCDCISLLSIIHSSGMEITIFTASPSATFTMWKKSPGDIILEVLLGSLMDGHGEDRPMHPGIRATSIRRTWALGGKLKLTHPAPLSSAPPLLFLLSLASSILLASPAFGTESHRPIRTCIVSITSSRSAFDLFLTDLEICPNRIFGDDPGVWTAIAARWQLCWDSSCNPRRGKFFGKFVNHLIGCSTITIKCGLGPSRIC